jgi:hypothetical protein
MECKTLKESPILGKRRHLALQHGWFHVEKDRQYFTHCSKTDSTPLSQAPTYCLQAVLQELTQMPADTKTDAAAAAAAAATATAADRWCFTAGVLNRVMRGSEPWTG